MQQKKPSFWTEARSLAATRGCVRAIAIVCVVLMMLGPRLVSFLMNNGRFYHSGPAVGVFALAVGYLLAALALGMLWQLDRFLGRLAAGAVFVPQNVAALRGISWYCAAAALICLPVGALLYLPIACMGIAAGFMALLVRVIKNAFAQAVCMKDELDYTV